MYSKKTRTADVAAITTTYLFYSLVQQQHRELNRNWHGNGGNIIFVDNTRGRAEAGKLPICRERP